MHTCGASARRAAATVVGRQASCRIFRHMGKPTDVRTYVDHLRQAHEKLPPQDARARTRLSVGGRANCPYRCLVGRWWQIWLGISRTTIGSSMYGKPMYLHAVM